MPTLPRTVTVSVVALAMLTVPLSAVSASHDGEPEAWSHVRTFSPVETPGLLPQIGEAVDLAGDTALVGAPGSGTAFAFTRAADGSWSQQDPLTPPGGASGQFGDDVALDDGDAALVGDPTNGEAHVFEQSGGSLSHATTLTPVSDARGFGLAVALDGDGDQAVVGSSAAGDGGAVWIFERGNSGWNQVLRVDGAANSGLGEAVALDDGTAAVGTAFGETVEILSEDGGWSASATLTGGTLFGVDVSLDGDTLAVGDQSGQGAAVVFERASPGSWTETATIPRPSLRAVGFGASVSIQGNTIAVGAPDASGTNGFQSGAAYVYTHHGGSWNQVDRLADNDAAEGEDSVAQFGTDVALDGGEALAGAPFDTGPSGPLQGSAQLFAAGCAEDGPVSSPVHADVEPAVEDQLGDGAEDDVHELNCRLVADKAGL